MTGWAAARPAMKDIRHPTQSDTTRDRMPELAQDGCRHKVGLLTRQLTFPRPKCVWSCRSALAEPAAGICVQTASWPLEDPHIVLVSATTANLFHRSKPAPAVLQFIPKGDGHLSARTLDSPRDD